MKNTVKVIFHIDLNQFFCSVAMLKNPRLRGKAFAIGRENTTKGVLSTASYEARKYGIHSGMPIIEALRLLPSLIIVNYPYELYRDYSTRFFALLHEYVTEIERTSIDEGYLDVTAITLEKNRHPYDLALEIQSRALKELGLPCSIGIAPTLFLAKMASDLKKPLGITILRIRDIKDVLGPLPVKEIFGIGKKTYPRLMEAHIMTILDFMNPLNEATVRKIVGNMYDGFMADLTGKSSNKVDPYRYSDHESISKSTTFDTPLVTIEEVIKNILMLADEVYLELKKSKKKAKTIGIILRDTNFRTITRSHSLDIPTNDHNLINYYLEELIEVNYENNALRLVGASVSNLTNDELSNIEITLFNVDEVYKKEEALLDLMDSFDKRFGEKSLFFGKELPKK